MSSIDITTPTTKEKVVDQAHRLMSELKKVSTSDDKESKVQSATILGSEVEDMITDMYIHLKNVFFSPENQDRSLMTEQEYRSKNAAIRYIDSYIDRSYAQWDDSLMDTFKKMNLIDDASAQKSTEERAALKIAETLKIIASEDANSEIIQSRAPPLFTKPTEPQMEKADIRTLDTLDINKAFSPHSMLPPPAAAAGGAKKATVMYKGKEYPVMEEEREDKKGGSAVVKKYILVDNKKRYLKKT